MASVPLTAADRFSVTYYAPQPRAVLRVVRPDLTDQVVEYDDWGRVELNTLTKEFFMPRFREHDEAIRRQSRPPYAWDGVAEVRPLGALEKKIVVIRFALVSVLCALRAALGGPHLRASP